MDVHEVYKIFQRYFRKKRMIWFQEHFKVSETTKILDVGGDQYNWQFLTCKPSIKIINLVKPDSWDYTLANFQFEIGNGTSISYPDNTFDIVYSNSVIEHLGSWSNQKLFAKEISRVGKFIYVQTPAYEFFVEPHLITPFVHWFSSKWQSNLLRNFTLWGLITRPSQKYVDMFLSQRRFLSLEEFRELFMECEIIREKVFGFTKSYIAVKLDEDRFHN